MDQLRNALIRAGLVEEKAAPTSSKPKKLRHKKWRFDAYKNRFGHPATFEIWRVGTFPRNWSTRCGLCGKPLEYEAVPWKATDEISVFICPNCFIHGRKHNPDRFPPLQEGM